MSANNKADKWAKFRAANYDGEGWGDDIPNSPPKAARSEQRSPTSPATSPVYNAAPLQQASPTSASPHHQTLTSGQFPQGASNGPKDGHESLNSPARTASPRHGPPQQPWAEQRAASPQSNKSPTLASKPLPFVRPADIYRRMEVEKEKERQSLESSRHSLESAPSAIDRDSAASPVATSSPVAPQPTPVASRRPVAVPSQQQQARSALEPVAERKSEYSLGAEGQPQASYQPGKVPSTVTSIDTAAEGPPSPSVSPSRRFSRSPQLPDVARMSMFGDDFFASALRKDSPPPLPALSSAFITSNSPAIIEEEKSPAPIDTANTSPPQTTSQSQPPAIADSPRPLAGESPNTILQQPANPLPANSGLGMQPIQPPPHSENLVQEQPVAALSPILEAKSPQSPSGLSVNEHARSQIPDDAEPAGEEPSVLSPAITSPAVISTVSADLPQPTIATSIPATMEDQSSTINITPTAPLNPRVVSNEPFDLPLPHRQSTFDTTTSSPVKESDVLREEIIQSLSPIGAAPPTDVLRPHQPQDSGIRESTYLPSVYDDYWATTADDKDNVQPNVPPLPEQAVAPLLPRAKSPERGESSPVTDSSAELRRRFSWEAEAEPTKSPTTVNGPVAAPVDSSLGTPATAPDVATASPEMTHRGGDENKSAELDPLVSREGAESRRGSEASATLDATTAAALASDAGLLADDATTMEPLPEGDPRRLSLAAEKQIMQLSSEEVENDLSEGHPALQDTHPESLPVPPSAETSAPQPPKLLSFREIMEIATPQERIQKFDETRVQFATMDQGLNNWIVTTRAHPEHNNVSSIFQAPGIQMIPGSAEAGGVGLVDSPTTAGVNQHAQQPYFQQYLNASSTQLGTPGRNTMPGTATHNHSSDFRHSSQQVGTKSKELLMAAGKAGKGLLSKGKNKLRGSTGDKVFL